ATSCAPYCPAASARQRSGSPDAAATSAPAAIANKTSLETAAEPKRMRPCLEEQPTSCGGADASRAAAPATASTPVPIGSDDPVRGRVDAPIAVVVYSDFECPYCAKLVPVLEQLLRRHPEQIRLV